MLKFQTKEAYEAAKFHLEAVGFTNLPDSATIDYTTPDAVQVSGNVQFKFSSIQSKNIVLLP